MRQGFEVTTKLTEPVLAAQSKYIMKLYVHFNMLLHGFGILILIPFLDDRAVVLNMPVILSSSTIKYIQTVGAGVLLGSSVPQGLPYFDKYSIFHCLLECYCDKEGHPFGVSRDELLESRDQLIINV